MRRIVTFILVFLMIFNLIIASGNSLVNASAVESEVIWLDKNYDYVSEFRYGLAKVRSDYKVGEYMLLSSK